MLHAGPEESSRERDLRFRTQKALTRLYFALAGTEADAGLPMPSADAPLVVREDDLGVRRRGMTTGFQRSVPAYLVMFVFLNLLVSGAGVAEDRASGRLRRMAMAPVSMRQITLGKLLGRFGIGWVQIACMLGVGLVAGAQWAAHFWVFFGFLSLFALASASLGILLGTLFKDPDKCASVAIWPFAPGFAALLAVTYPEAARRLQP